MGLFDNYLSEFDGVLSKRNSSRQQLQNEQRNLNDAIQKGIQVKNFANFEGQLLPEKIEGPKVILKYDKSHLTKYFGENQHSFDAISIGPHPDFKELAFNSTLYHYCVVCMPHHTRHPHIGCHVLRRFLCNHSWLYPFALNP